MSNYFYCKVCDKSIKIASKKKHFNSLNHKFLSMSTISRYSITNPDFLHIENILKNYVFEYNKKFAFYLIICKWKIHFSDTSLVVQFQTWYSVYDSYYSRDYLLSKTKYFERQGHKFSHISEMNITFITDIRNMTYKHCLQQPKSMLKWKLNALLAKNPKLIKIFGNSSHPLIRKYQYIK